MNVLFTAPGCHSDKAMNSVEATLMLLSSGNKPNPRFVAVKLGEYDFTAVQEGFVTRDARSVFAYGSRKFVAGRNRVVVNFQIRRVSQSKSIRSCQRT